MIMEKYGRNDPCPCGSGKKYKQCCSSIKASSHENKITQPSSQEIEKIIGLFSKKNYTTAAILANEMTLKFPMHEFGWKALGSILTIMGKSEEALKPLQKAASLSPTDAEAHCTLAAALKYLGRLDEAETSCRQALKINPNHAVANYNLGIILQGLNRLDEAEASYRLAINSRPDYVDAYNNLGAVLKDMGRLSTAVTCYKQALRLKPDHAEAHGNLGNTFNSMGCPLEALHHYRQALQIKPDYAEAHSNLLYCLSHNTTTDTKILFQEHCQFGNTFEAPFHDKYPAHINLRTPLRPLQIGFVSGDFRDHAISSFIEPILIYLSKNSQLLLHAYSNNSTEDALSIRFRKYFLHWHIVENIADTVLAEKIRADNIDILIDLSGHTAKNRLPMFARKPAPLQISWMGYPGTTGLKSMDYYIADRFLLPQGEFENQFIEKIVRLPSNAPFMPASGCPEINLLPALKENITFGSFNRFNKLSPDVIALWSKIIKARSGSKILMAAITENGEKATIINWFSKEGIDKERLEFHGRCDLLSYLALHHRVDICLDTFPYNGGTTTLNALWMGVPTLTLTGSTIAGRCGAAILSHVGLEEFIAHDADDFVRKGVLLTENLNHLATIRAGLRERFEQSAMGQPELIAASLELALRNMWRRWCAGLPAESFEVTREEANNALQAKAETVTTN